MHAVRHLVGAQRLVDRVRELGAAAADVEHDRLRPLEETVEMPLEERGVPRPHPQSLPHAVPEHEPRIEHRHDGPLARHELAVHPDENALVTRVVLEVMRAVGHRAEL
jgi:hypothetical protein